MFEQVFVRGSVCTKAAQNERIAEQVRDLQEEVRREEQINKERQRLYSAKYRAKKKLKVEGN